MLQAGVLFNKCRDDAEYQKPDDNEASGIIYH